MKKIAHISDLHFGSENPRIAEALAAELHALAPDLVAVSGDLTQRARRTQFAAARAWLAHLPKPQIVVPGNHDVPLYDVAQRAFAPLRRFQGYITKDLFPVHVDDELAVVGLNTARAAALKEGSISSEQIERVREVFAALDGQRFKVIVAHHPVQLGQAGSGKAAVVGRVRQALQGFERAGVDLILTGHLHLGHMADTRCEHGHLERSMLVIQAGTAISVRERGEPNSFNWIVLDGERVRCESRGWDGVGFVVTRVVDSARVGPNWILAPLAALEMRESR